MQFSRTFLSFFKKPSVEEFKIMDCVGDSYKLIYRNRLDKYIKAVAAATLGSAIVIVIIHLYYQEKAISSKYSPENKTFKAANNEGFLFVAVFIGIAVLAQVLLQKLPVRIYYLGKEQKYVCIFQSSVPTSIKKVQYARGQVTKFPATGILPWRELHYRIETPVFHRNVILADNYFRRPGDLYVMLGMQDDPEVDDRFPY